MRDEKIAHRGLSTTRVKAYRKLTFRKISAGVDPALPFHTPGNVITVLPSRLASLGSRQSALAETVQKSLKFLTCSSRKGYPGSIALTSRSTARIFRGCRKVTLTGNDLGLAPQRISRRWRP